tara:strand:+ start:1114 stop:2289 length:1176 start_codon:yes stop_codon:yes gene_type:complete
MSEESINQVQEINEEVSTSEGDANKANLMSFDDLDNLTDDRSDKELLNEAKKVSEEKGEKDKPEPKEQSNAEEKKVDAEKAEESEEAEEVKEIKKLLGKFNEEEMEIAAETLFKHKVDGEDVDVSLQDLLNNYSGKVSYDKKFQEFSESKKEFDEYKTTYDKDIDLINGYINDFAEKLKSNDAMGALSYFAEFSGMEPHTFKRQLLDQLAPEIERMSLLSPEQIENERLAQENDYLQKQQESEANKRQQEQSQNELLSEIKRLQEAHSISDDEFQGAYQELVDGNFDGEITPEIVAEYYVHSAAFSKSEAILDQVNPDLVNNDQIVESLQKVVVENPSFDDNDLLEIVQEVYGSSKKQASKAVSKKVAQAAPKQVTEVSKDKQTYVSFDDL